MRKMRNSCLSAKFVLISSLLILMLSGCGGSSGGSEGDLETDSPVAKNFSISGLMNQDISIDFVIQNTGDIDFSTLSIIEVPEYGSLTDGAESGVLIYTPNIDFTGDDSFTYTVQDSSGNQADNAVVSIIISTEAAVIIPDEHTPVASDFTISGTNNQAMTIDFSQHISDEDNDVDFATLTIITPPENGNLTDGSSHENRIYTPGTDFTGEDTFSFTVQDSQGNSSGTATATLTIILNVATWGNVNWDDAHWAE